MELSNISYIYINIHELCRPNSIGPYSTVFDLEAKNIVRKRDHGNMCDLMNINEFSVDFDLQVKYFLHIDCWETPQNSVTSSIFYAIVELIYPL